MQERLRHFEEQILKLYRNNKILLAFYVAATILTLLPVLILLVELIHYSVNVPWWDQLSFVSLMQKLHNDTLTIKDLWAQHNEHRILVPQAVELVFGKVTGFNFRVPVLLNWVTAAASFGLLLSMLRRTLSSTKLFALLAVVLAWMFFSPIQYVNWIWGFQLVFFMGVFFAILAIWLLTSPNKASWLIFGLAIASAMVSTYSVGNGLLVWPIGLGLLLWQKTDRARLAWWIGVGLVVIASYFYKFQRPSDSPTISMLIREPVAVVKYVLGYLGRNLATTPTTARYAGFIMIIVIAISVWFIYKKGNVDKITGWLALGAYGVLSGVLAAISRLNYGIDHGFMSTSYPTISLTFILATIVIMSYALCVWMKEFNKKRIGTYLSVFFIVGFLYALAVPPFISNFAEGSSNLKLLGLHLREVQSCVYTATSPNDNCLLIVAPNKSDAWHTIQVLKELKWGHL